MPFFWSSFSAARLNLGRKVGSRRSPASARMIRTPSGARGRKIVGEDLAGRARRMRLPTSDAGRSSAHDQQS